MKYLLDTNTCIFVINRRPSAVRGRFEETAVGDIAISVVTLSELQYGVEKSVRREQNALALRKFLLPLVLLPFDADAAGQYGKVRVQLERRGTPIGSMDMMIAAHALARGLSLVTNNTSEFECVPGLALEDWTADGE
jgi:tRNA(fMet)-specific endonuclease VapC